ncbi:MAG: hypothetical protein WC523_04665 [Patescibacteria group bacterium]
MEDFSIYLPLQEIMDKYNVDHFDPTLTAMEKFLLNKLNEVQTEAKNEEKNIEIRNAEIIDRQNKNVDSTQRLSYLNGQNKSLLDTLLEFYLEEKNNANG